MIVFPPSAAEKLAAAKAARDKAERERAARKAERLSPKGKKAPKPDEVLDFLKRIRGLNSLPPKELEQLLYTRRFELLGLLNSSDTAAGKTESTDSLPKYNAIPDQHQLHEALLTGKIPCGYQCIAHVLYPDSVSWPEVSAAKREPVEQPATETPAAADAQPTSEKATSSSPGKQRSPQATSGEEKLAATPDTEAASSQGSKDQSGAAATSKKRSSDPEENQQISDPASEKKTQTKLSGIQHGVQHGVQENSACFTLCGQKHATTVRGKLVLEQTEDLLSMYMKAADDERYNAARDERLRLERAVKLEQYQERRLMDKINNLDILKSAEVDLQNEIRKRDSRRVSRKAELKKDLEEAWAIKLKKEAEDKELAKQEQEKEAEEKKRQKQYHEKQKQAVAEWQKEKAERPPPDEDELARQEAEKLAQEKRLEKEKEEKLKSRSVKAQLADEKTQRKLMALAEATEQRPPRAPPRPPRPHDLAQPGAAFADDTASSARQVARQSPVSWTIEAKKVSDNYGLTPREMNAVAQRMGKGNRIQGAGRMAKCLER